MVTAIHMDLHYAASDGNTEAVCSLLSAGFNVNAFDDTAWTPLHCAAYHGHLAIVRLLLSLGADVNAHDEFRVGDSPLGEVAGTCSLEMAKTLVAAGADPSIRGWMQLSALDRAKVRTDEAGLPVYELLRSVHRSPVRAEPDAPPNGGGAEAPPPSVS